MTRRRRSSESAVLFRLIILPRLAIIDTYKGKRFRFFHWDQVLRLLRERGGF